MKSFYLLVLFSLLGMFGCNQLSENASFQQVYLAGREDEVVLCAPGSKKDTASIDAESGHLKSTGVNSQLHVITEGFNIVPVSGLKGLASFIPNLDSAVVFGDIIINETDLATVHTSLAAQGLTIKDAHRYGARNGSIILFLHVNGFGNKTRLSASVSSLSRELRPRIDKSFKDRRSIPNADLNRQRLDSIIGYSGQDFGSIYKYSVSRPDVLKSRGIPVSPHLEFSTWASWQGTAENAVVAGNFVILENEVGPVIKALAESGYQL